MKATFPPTRTEWPERAAKVSYPVPEVTSNDPCPAVKPGPVFALEALAVSQGWDVRVTYARGNPPHPITGKPLAVRDSWAVRCSRGRTRAVAVREGDSWRSFWWWSDETFFQRLNLLAEFESVLQVENTPLTLELTVASRSSQS